MQKNYKDVNYPCREIVLLQLCIIKCFLVACKSTICFPWSNFYWTFMEIKQMVVLDSKERWQCIFESDKALHRGKSGCFSQECHSSLWTFSSLDPSEASKSRHQLFWQISEASCLWNWALAVSGSCWCRLRSHIWSRTLGRFSLDVRVFVASWSWLWKWTEIIRTFVLSQVSSSLTCSSQTAANPLRLVDKPRKQFSLQHKLSARCWRNCDSGVKWRA